MQASHWKQVIELDRRYLDLGERLSPLRLVIIHIEGGKKVQRLLFDW